MGIYWTRQNERAWAYAQEVGYLEGNLKHIPPDNIIAYEWLMGQMSMKLKRYNGEYPIWLFLSMPKFEKGKVVLEIDLDDKDVLVSDFDDFQQVKINRSLFTEEEHDEYLFVESSELQEEMLRNSWKRIFDLKSDEHQNLQGTTGRIELKNIKKVTTELKVELYEWIKSQTNDQ